MPLIERLGADLNERGTPFAIFEVNQLTITKAGELFGTGHVQRVLICGGDGTINRVTSLLIDYIQDVAFGIIPCGTGNLIARSLLCSESISLDDFAMVENPVTFREIQIGQANCQYFLYVVSVGLTADTVSAVEIFRNSAVGSMLFRKLGGFTIYVLTFLSISPVKSFFRRFRDAPPSRAWIRTRIDTKGQDFAFFSGLWTTIVHYRDMLMPDSILPKWKSSYTPMTTKELHIEHRHPFSWQVDGVPQRNTRSLKIDFHYRTMRVRTIRQEQD